MRFGPLIRAHGLAGWSHSMDLKEVHTSEGWT